MPVPRTFQRTAEDAQDVSQTVWLRLVESLANLREPEALPGWLATTTQRECMRHVRGERRGLPVGSPLPGAFPHRPRPAARPGLPPRVRPRAPPAARAPLSPPAPGRRPVPPRGPPQRLYQG